MKRMRGAVPSAYKRAISQPSTSLVSTAMVPYVKSRDVGSITITNREYISDIFAPSGGAFDLGTVGTPHVTFPQYVSPSNPALFPWLSQISNNWQEYEFKDLKFEYRSMSADALSATNTALGSVVCAMEYDAVTAIAAPFGSKAEMEQEFLAISCKPSESMLMKVDCKPRHTVLPELFTGNPTALTGDQRFYALGGISFATQGGQQTTTADLGELWVSYKCKFLKPKLGTPPAASFALLRAPWNGSLFGLVTGAIADRVVNLGPQDLRIDDTGTISVRIPNVQVFVQVSATTVDNTTSVSVDMFPTGSSGGPIYPGIVPPGLYTGSPQVSFSYALATASVAPSPVGLPYGIATFITPPNCSVTNHCDVTFENPVVAGTAPEGVVIMITIIPYP